MKVSLTFCNPLRSNENTWQKDVALSLTFCQWWDKIWSLMRLLRRKKDIMLTSYWSKDEIWWLLAEEKSKATHFLFIMGCKWDCLVEKGCCDSPSVTHGMRSDNTVWQKTGALWLTSCWSWDEVGWPKKGSLTACGSQDGMRIIMRWGHLSIKGTMSHTSCWLDDQRWDEAVHKQKTHLLLVMGWEGMRLSSRKLSLTSYLLWDAILWQKKKVLPLTSYIGEMMRCGETTWHNKSLLPSHSLSVCHGSWHNMGLHHRKKVTQVTHSLSWSCELWSDWLKEEIWTLPLTNCWLWDGVWWDYWGEKWALSLTRCWSCQDENEWDYLAGKQLTSWWLWEEKEWDC